jgi:hypothetical protein
VVYTVVFSALHSAVMKVMSSSVVWIQIAQPKWTWVNGGKVKLSL